MSVEIFVPASEVHAPSGKRKQAGPGVKGNSREIRRYGGRTMLVSSDRDKANERRLTDCLRDKLRALGTQDAEVTLMRAGAPVRASMIFFMPIPESFPAWKKLAALEGRFWPVVRPDRGNMLKLIEDALAKSGWLHDDAQVVDGGVKKIYGGVPGYLVVLEPLRQATRETELARSRVNGAL
jgi:Holliday junction resolvase RusA-like endonuclease